MEKLKRLEYEVNERQKPENHVLKYYMFCSVNFVAFLGANLLISMFTIDNRGKFLLQ